MNCETAEMLSASPAVLAQVKRDALNRLRLGHPKRLALHFAEPAASAELRELMVPAWRDWQRAMARRMRGAA